MAWFSQKLNLLSWFSSTKLITRGSLTIPLGNSSFWRKFQKYGKIMFPTLSSYVSVFLYWKALKKVWECRKVEVPLFILKVNHFIFSVNNLKWVLLSHWNFLFEKITFQVFLSKREKLVYRQGKISCICVLSLHCIYMCSIFFLKIGTSGRKGR